jgi:hypothetical protein
MNIDLSTSELLALVKVLSFIRFKSNDYEASYLAASPIVAGLHQKFYRANHDYFVSKGLKGIGEFGTIESFPEVIETIRGHILNFENWQDLTPEQQREIVHIFISPYSASEETISMLSERTLK